MRKLHIIGIIIVIVLMAVLAVMMYMKFGAQGAQPVIVQTSVGTSPTAGTGEVLPTQETLQTTQQPTQETLQLTQQATQETQTLYATQETLPSTQETTQEEAPKGPIDLQKIEKTFTHAPYNLTFTQQVNRATNKKTTVAVSDGITIETVGNADNNLDSARISVTLKKDRSNKNSALKLVGNFAQTINRNIVDNDMVLLKNMYVQASDASTAGSQPTQGHADGLGLGMTISNGNPPTDGSTTGTTQITQESGSSPDDSLTLEIDQPPVVVPVNPEDIHFLSDLLNKNGASGTWEISGMLIDTSKYAMSGVQVKATLYDSSGAVLDSQNGWVQAPVLHPAIETPFLIRIDAPPANFDHYELSIPLAG